MSTSKSTKYTDAERAEYRQAKRTEQRAAVEQATKALLTSDGWKAWAETRTTFHDYSMGNCMLIAMQKPDATQVAGFRKWQELGRHVNKGQKAIHIMAPMSVKREDAQGEEERVTFFRSVSVFDISQTDGEPLPQAPREPITGSSHERYLEPLKDIARSMGIAVYEYEPTTAAQGFYDEKGKRIVISDRLAPNAKVRTLIHELAHAHGVTYKDYSRGEAEVIVETAATIVCGALGLDTSGESIPYIAGWGESGDLEAIRKHAVVVDDIASKLERGCKSDAIKPVVENKPKAKPQAKPTTHDAFMVKQLLAAKFYDRAPKRVGEWPIELRHNGTIIKDQKTARAYLKAI